MSKTMASRLVASLRQARSGDGAPTKAQVPAKSLAKAALKTKAKPKYSVKAKPRRSAKAKPRAAKTRFLTGKTKTRAVAKAVRVPRQVVPRGARFARQNDQAPSPTSLDRPWENLHPQRIWPD